MYAITEFKLPASEKTTNPILDVVAIITGAGFKTTAGALRTAPFHVFDKTEVLQRLRAEIATIDTRGPQTLKQLPYLKVVLLEGLRMSLGLSLRQSRIGSDRDLIYWHHRIPAGICIPVGVTLVLLQDETRFPEPRNFIPDRWVDPYTGPGLDKSFASFLRGTKACLGMQRVFLLLPSPHF